MSETFDYSMNTKKRTRKGDIIPIIIMIYITIYSCLDFEFLNSF